jgi:hypothetical protein
MLNDGYVPERFNAMNFLEFRFVNSTSYVGNIPISSCHKSTISLCWKILICSGWDKNSNCFLLAKNYIQANQETNKITPWSRLLPEILVKFQLAKSLAIYGTVSFTAELKEHAIGVALNQTNTLDTVTCFALGFILMSFKKPKCH